jgi:hypothetical protein
MSDTTTKELVNFERISKYGYDIHKRILNNSEVVTNNINKITSITE